MILTAAREKFLFRKPVELCVYWFKLSKDHVLNRELRFLVSLAKAWLVT